MKNNNKFIDFVKKQICKIDKKLMEIIRMESKKSKDLTNITKAI